MDSDNKNYEVKYCEDDGEYRVYCDICDDLCLERFYRNHLKSETDINNIHKKKTKITINKCIIVIFAIK